MVDAAERQEDVRTVSNWWHHRMDVGWDLSDTVLIHDLWADDYGKGKWEPYSAEEQAQRRADVRSNFLLPPSLLRVCLPWSPHGSVARAR